MILDKKNLILEVKGGYGFIFGSLRHLLENATGFITKRDSYFITKCDKSILQDASGFLLQNATVLLQNATVITKLVDFITKYDSYYKIC